MATGQTHEPFIQEHEAALAARLETWVAHLPPREQQLLARALRRASARRQGVHGHGECGGKVAMRTGLAYVVARFLPPQSARPGSTLGISP